MDVIAIVMMFAGVG
jgi:hypothetical protein